MLQRRVKQEKGTGNNSAIILFNIDKVIFGQRFGGSEGVSCVDV